MKPKIYAILITLTVVLAAVGLTTAYAAYAYDVQFTTYITYQNIGDAATNSISISLYDGPDDTTPIVVSQPNLEKDASTSVSVGSLGAPDGFHGAAVLSADQPMAATLVQLPPPPATEPNARNRPLSNGFDTGTEKVLLASVLKKYTAKEQTSRFGVQNTGSTPTTVTLSFYGSSPTAVYTFTQVIQPNAGYFVDAGTITQLPDGFSGSAVLSTIGGTLVASVMETDGVNYGSKAFEGVGVGASPVYMPSALCNFNAGGVIQNSYYAIQNTSATQNANITVTWSNGNTATANNVAPYTKAVFSGCDGGNPNGFLGSATVTSTQPVIGLGKVSGGGLSTAFIGATSGVDNTALPYIRWANDTNWTAGKMQRANIAIQNVGGSPITGIITVKYVNPDGTIAGTHTIDTSLLAGGNLPVGGKVNSNPTNAGLTEFGCYNSCTTFGGGAIIEGPVGTQLTALARLTSYVPATGDRVGEDASGIPIP